MPTVSPLPDDIATLQRLLIDRDQMIAKLMVEIARLLPPDYRGVYTDALAKETTRRALPFHPS